MVRVRVRVRARARARVRVMVRVRARVTSQRKGQATLPVRWAVTRTERPGWG